MDNWVGGLFCLFLGLGMLMAASQALPPLHIKNKWQGAGLGCGITALLHSSSAVSCSVCAMVAGGSMELSAAFAVLVGSNVGTCFTPILTALGLRAAKTGAVFAVIGIIAILLKPKFPEIATSVAGFCLLMWGMNLMTLSPAFFDALSQNPLWKLCLSMPLGAFLIGLVSTAVLQSSSLTMALLQVYSLSSPLSTAIALPFILGQNIGTTATALLATVGADSLARKVAMYHLRFNVLGALWALPLSLILYKFLSFEATPMVLAVLQLLYNTVCAWLHLMFDKKLG